jgi:molybdopterin-guanine dinucleotide biosynthesis protein
MSKQNAIAFLRDCSRDGALLEKFQHKNLPEVIFHAKSIGYGFESEHLTAVIDDMETQIITQRMGEEINAYSSLWPKMWGKYRLQYVVEELFNTFAESELGQFLA